MWVGVVLVPLKLVPAQPSLGLSGKGENGGGDFLQLRGKNISKE